MGVGQANAWPTHVNTVYFFSWRSFSSSFS